jgi:hypothetical protein
MIWLAGATVLLTAGVVALLWLLLAAPRRALARRRRRGRRGARGARGALRTLRSGAPGAGAAAPAGPAAAAPRWDALPDGVVAAIMAAAGPQ